MRVALTNRDDERRVTDLHRVRVVERLAIDLHAFDHAEKVAAHHILASFAEEEPDFIEHATVLAFEASLRDAQPRDHSLAQRARKSSRRVQVEASRRVFPVWRSPAVDDASTRTLGSQHDANDNAGAAGVCGAAPEFASFRNPEISKHNSGPQALEISLGFRDFKIRITVPRFHDFVEIWESFNVPDFRRG